MELFSRQRRRLKPLVTLSCCLRSRQHQKHQAEEGVENGSSQPGGSVLFHQKQACFTKSSIAHKSSKPFRFLELPLEIRLAIYAQILQYPLRLHVMGLENETTPPLYRMVWTADYFTYLESGTSRTAILLASEQVREEGIAAFLEVNDFFFMHLDQMAKWIHYLERKDLATRVRKISWQRTQKRFPEVDSHETSKSISAGMTALSAMISPPDTRLFCIQQITIQIFAFRTTDQEGSETEELILPGFQQVNYFLKGTQNFIPPKDEHNFIMKRLR
jgi:hypothetical protein